MKAKQTHGLTSPDRRINLMPPKRRRVSGRNGFYFAVMSTGKCVLPAGCYQTVGAVNRAIDDVIFVLKRKVAVIDHSLA